jgi:hypothetical protein
MLMPAAQCVGSALYMRRTLRSVLYTSADYKQMMHCYLHVALVRLGWLWLLGGVFVFVFNRSAC